MRIRIGTRSSILALWQADFVAKKLSAAGFDFEIVSVKTVADKILEKPLSEIGVKGLFTDQLDRMLAGGEIDIAVHSAKDVQSTMPPEFELIAFTTREKANDVVVSFDPKFKISSGGPIGTSSTRRRALLRSAYPKVKVVEARGNLHTRFKKMKEGQFSAMVLAYAGVVRMDNAGYITQRLSLEEFTPPAGQGSLAIQVRSEMDAKLKSKIILATNDPVANRTVKCERSVLRTMDGGCSVPVFAYAELHSEEISVTAGVATLDGSKVIRRSGRDRKENFDDLGVRIAQDVLDGGGAEVLASIMKERNA